MIDFTDISVAIIRRTFRTRFRLASLTGRSSIFRKLVKRLFFEGDDIQVIPRNSSIEINRSIPVPENLVLPSEVLRRMILRSRHIFLMDFCICRVSSDCSSYPHDLGCLFLGPGAMRISEKVGRLVSAGEALEHIERCQEAGLVHIIGRNRIDSVWLNSGPHDELLSICNCCECCCLWKMTPLLSEDIASSITPMEGVELKREEASCVLCGRCEDVCFTGAIGVGSEVEHDPGRCLICGRCAESCPEGAIKIMMDPEAVEDAIKRVEVLVDVES
ncbi:MAG: 4Fe-4S binding protein [Methanothermobacter sp.]|nr:4Fe-4S binding protein [Methanothermobacter sp.]